MSRDLLKKSLIGAGIGVGVAAAMLIVLGAVLTKCGDPTRLVDVFAAAARFLGAAVAGFFAARMVREKGFVSGALSGGLYSLTVPLIAAFSEGKFRIFPILLVCLICTAIAALTGIIGIPSEKSGNARRKAMMKKVMIDHRRSV